MILHADTVDDNPGDGICADANGGCSLRAAIEEANLDGQASEINMDNSLTQINLIANLPSLTEDGTNISGSVSGGRIGVFGSVNASIGFTVTAANCTIRNCTISGFTIGILVFSDSPGLNIFSNTIDFNSTGIDFSMTNASINFNRIDQNGTAIRINPSINSNDQLHVINNSFSDNTQVIAAQSQPTNYRLSNNSMECNDLPFTNAGNISAPTISLACLSYVKGTATPKALIEVFRHNRLGCPNSPWQGGTVLGVTRADSNGDWILPALCNDNLIFGDSLTAIAMDEFNSSVFSNGFSVGNDCMGTSVSSLKVIKSGDLFLLGNSFGSLRDMLDCANAHPDIDNIHFDIPGDGPHLIPLFTSLHLNDPGIVIDGTTQPDYYSGKIRLEANGFTSDTALVINSSSCSIFGLEISGFNDVVIGAGIFLGDTASHIQIGAPNKGNILGGNNYGLFASDELNGLVVQGNFFGLDADLVTPNANIHGIYLETFQSANATALIGGKITEEEGNLIAHNSESGIRITGVSIGELSIQGNDIHNNGINIAEGSGIHISSSDGITIGGSPNEANDIHSNFFGIYLNIFVTNVQTLFNKIFSNSLEGIILESNTNTNNLISQNSIYCNGTGIDLNNSGNLNKMAPSITSAGFNLISGTAAANDIVEVFIKDDGQCLPLRSNTLSKTTNQQQMNDCQGKTYLGTTLANVDGTWTLLAPFASQLPLGAEVTATATDFDNNTSEFGACFSISNDECVSAFALPMNATPCVGDNSITLNTATASTSIEPFGLCANMPNRQDVWLKVSPPYTNNFLVKPTAAFSNRIHVEAYKDASVCVNLSPILCDTIQATDEFLIFEGDVLGFTQNETIYLRLWVETAAGMTTTGTFSLAAHILDSNPANWNVLCDLEGGEIASDEFVVIFEDIATIADAQAVQLELEAEGAVLLDFCYCGTPFLQLWQVDDLIELAACRKTATNRTKVDTTDFNFLLGDLLCQGSGQVSPLFPFDYTPAPNANEVTIAVIDTGVDDDHGLLSPFLWQNSGTQCFQDVVFGYDFVHNDTNPDDLDGHGTAVSGTFIRFMPNDVAPKLMNLKVYENGVGNVFDAVCAMRYAIANEVDMMNLSWGLKRDSIPFLLKKVLQEAAAEDILIVTSSGNTSENNNLTRKWPANHAANNIISVGAYEIDLIGLDTALAFYSNFGDNAVDLAALGFVESTFLDNSVRTLGGTSLAAPLVARTAAIIRARYPCLTAPQVKNCIVNNVTKVSDLKNKMRSGGALSHIRAMQSAAILARDCAVLSLAEANWNVHISSKEAVTISWEVEGLEEGTFYIQKSIDGFYWENIATIPAQANQFSYRFLDDTPSSEVVYYQLIYEENGEKLYSRILEAKGLNHPKNNLKVFPNPTFSNKVQLSIPSAFQNGSLEIADYLGQIIWKRTLNDADLSLPIEIELPFGEKGVFLISVKNKGNLVSKKLVVL